MGSWEIIRRDGLRTAAQLIEAADEIDDDTRQMLHRNVRSNTVRLAVAGDWVELRDQGRLLVRRDLSPIFGDDLTLEQWVLLLNRRVYLFGKRREMSPLLEKYAAREGQDVIEVDARRLVDYAGDRLELADQNTGAVARTAAPQKFRTTFRPLSEFSRERPVKEITVVDGIPDIRRVVRAAFRNHPDGRQEQLA